MESPNFFIMLYKYTLFLNREIYKSFANLDKEREMVVSQCYEVHIEIILILVKSHDTSIL